MHITLRLRQNGCHFPDDIVKCIFLNENVWFLIKFSLKFVPNGPTNNIPALFQIMGWRRSGDKPLSESMVISLLTHISGFPRVLISGKSPYFQLLPSRPWKSPYFWIFSIEVREKSWFSIAVTKPRWSTSSCASWGFSKCCGNDVELFGNPSDPLTNHRWRMVWRHLVPAKIPRASFINFYYVVTESQSADTWCHVVVVRNLIGPHSRRYTWRTLCKTSSIFVEIRQHT